MPRLQLLQLLVNAAWLGACSYTPTPAPKKVMIWWANPNNATTINTTVADLRRIRKSFTGIAYQAYAICGEGSNAPTGSNDCSSGDAVGTPHFAHGHPVGVPSDLGATIRAIAGESIELWPVISYGNPGEAAVLNRLIADPIALNAFADAAIKEAHSKGLTGFNLDLETSGILGLDNFLQTLTSRLHGATPQVLLSYDGSNTPVSRAPLDRWISMASYTPDINGFISCVSQGVAHAGAAFGVGLCPACFAADAQGVKARLDAVDSIGKGTIRELDVWAYGTGPNYEVYWPQLQGWLARP